jgi:hypothetical protein
MNRTGLEQVRVMMAHAYREHVEAVQGYLKRWKTLEDKYNDVGRLLIESRNDERLGAFNDRIRVQSGVVASCAAVIMAEHALASWPTPAPTRNGAVKVEADR